MNIKLKIKDKQPENYLFFFIPLDAEDLSKGGELLVDSEPATVPGGLFIRRLGKTFSHRDFFVGLRVLPEFKALAEAGYTYSDLPRGRCDVSRNGFHSLEGPRDFLPALLDAVQNQLRVRINSEEIFAVDNLYGPLAGRMKKAIDLYWQTKKENPDHEN